MQHKIKESLQFYIQIEQDTENEKHAMQSFFFV